jgi:hypothetical protein
MGAAISQSVKSKLQTQTLAELLSDDKVTLSVKLQISHER